MDEMNYGKRRANGTNNLDGGNDRNSVLHHPAKEYNEHDKNAALAAKEGVKNGEY